MSEPWTETWQCVECGPSVRFNSASAMHFDAYGHTPYLIARRPPSPEKPMNVDPTSQRFTEVVAWNSLTEAEQKSGDWIQLPDVSGEPARARKASLLDRFSRGTSQRA
jgi:hypothetical protein